MNPERAARLAEQAADDAVRAAKIAHERATSIPRPPAPDPRDAPHFELLQRGDGGMLARINPRRTRWPELQAIDARISDADARQVVLVAELAEVRDRRQGADAAHAVQLADWFQAGQQGPRPVAESGELDDRIALLESEVAACDIARDRLFEERVSYVTRRRKSLVRDAERATSERLARCLSLVDQLEQAREELVACRSTEMWAHLYPSEALASDPPYTHALAGARLSIQQQHLPGIKAQLPAHNVFALLRDDAQHCATVATVEQAAEIQGTSKGTLSGRDAAWQDRTAELERERQEKEAARRRFREEWGYDPPEFA